MLFLVAKGVLSSWRPAGESKLIVYTLQTELIELKFKIIKQEWIALILIPMFFY
jgi:hypothetical protein